MEDDAAGLSVETIISRARLGDGVLGVLLIVRGVFIMVRILVCISLSFLVVCMAS